MPTDIVRAAIDLPAALDRSEPATVRVEIETTEVVDKLPDGTSYRYCTFDGKVPGPFVLVRVGDTVEVKLKNHESQWMQHEVDFHAVTGLLGGDHATVAEPGEDLQGFTFKALNLGLCLYHCAMPLAAHHIANGMYGLTLVAPESGLPELTGSYDKLMAEPPEHYVFNDNVWARQRREGRPVSRPLRLTVVKDLRAATMQGGSRKD